MLMTVAFLENLKLGEIFSQLYWFDLIVGLVLIWGVIDGYIRGFVHHFSRLVGLAVTVVISLHFYGVIAEAVISHSSIPPGFVMFLSLAITASVVGLFMRILIMLSGKLANLECEYFLERVVGGFAGGLRFMLFLSLILNLVATLNISLVKKFVEDESASGVLVTGIAPGFHNVSVNVTKAVIKGVAKAEKVEKA